VAVSFVATIQRFQGLSTDDKPTAVPEGSTFLVIDPEPGEYVAYLFHDGMWEPDPRYARAPEMVL
jgi:hypothetical protein